MKRLDELWPQVSAAHAAVTVSAIVQDSRDLRPGMLFLALKGGQRDGHEFIAEVIAKGASAVFAEQDDTWRDDTVINGVPVIVIARLDLLAGPIVAGFFDQPSRKLDVLAVTGTNGKTSVANLMAHALTRLGKPCGVLGTLGNGMAGRLEKSTHTTLQPCQLQALLAQFVEEGAACVAMEASSHGLDQGRMSGIAIRVALFTNLTRDHLDYHGDMESYTAAKELLFRWPQLQTAVLNADDPVSTRFARVLDADVRLLRYSQRADSDAEIRALSVIPTMSGLELRVSTPAGDCELTVPLLGRFNVSNLLAVIGGLLALDLPIADIADALRNARPVTGRMQSFSGDHPTVVVDYAHTPDALEKALSSLREHVRGRLTCVFGCGGDRDTGKRAEMGAIASHLADSVVITSDNPRSEDPQAIIDAIRAGTAGKAVSVETDRRTAIATAILAAGPDDVVLVAGKGHEDYQEIAGVRHPFSDLEEVRAALARWRSI